VKIVVDPLPTHPHLARNGGDVHLVGEEVMNFVIALDPLLMQLFTFLAPFVWSCQYARGP
jgi:hypothetical protein